jgi:hypothetical protein
LKDPTWSHKGLEELMLIMVYPADMNIARGGIDEHILRLL